MKRILLLLLLSLCGAMALAQEGSQPAFRLAPEVSAKTNYFLFHGNYDINVGVRIDDVVLGVGAGYGILAINANPASVRSVPMYVYARDIYFSVRNVDYSCIWTLLPEGSITIRYLGTMLV